MRIGDEVLIKGTINEIRKDIVIIENEGGYFGTVPSEIVPSINLQEPKTGHLIKIDTNQYTCDCCRTCFTIDLDDNNITQFSYCPKCEAKMVEPQERKGIKNES